LIQKTKYKILITGGAGFIGSNLVDFFLEQGHAIVCLDNLSTGFEKNISHHFSNPKFPFINGDIRNYVTCQEAVNGCDYVLHQAALGSVPRSINDPISTNDVNITGFLNVLQASKEANIKRFVYAASSSTYGDSKTLPKIEHEIGTPLSPYAVTKYVNELYANVYANTYNMECIGLRYFNVFGKRQSPEGAYAAVIPLWVHQLMTHKSPIINGDGSYSRDFTYIDNVIEANEKALFSSKEVINKKRSTFKNDTSIVETSPFSEVFNIAFGGNTTLIELFNTLKENLSLFDKEINNIQVTFGSQRAGDIPHSQASINKAIQILDYQPKYSASEGFKKVAEWYFNNLQ